MALLTFAAGDKDYIAKLNQMSQNAGDTAQLKADTQDIKAETKALKDETSAIKADTQAVRDAAEAIRQQTQAIATGDLVFVGITENREVSHGDLLLAQVPGLEFFTSAFKTDLTAGHWFTVENASEGFVYVVPSPGLELKGRKGVVKNGDRFGISPGNSFTFRAINNTELRIK